MPATGQPLLGPRQPAADYPASPAEAKQGLSEWEGEGAGSKSQGTFGSYLVFAVVGEWRRGDVSV